MSETINKMSDIVSEIDAVIKRISAVSHLFEISSIRFADCAFSYKKESGLDAEVVRIGVNELHAVVESDTLEVAIVFEFVAPSPLPDEKDMYVKIRASMRIAYSILRDRGEAAAQDTQMFGRVNGVYNAWPYLREFVQSSLVRLGLPPYELPLLRAVDAAQLAGLVEAGKDATAQ